MSVPPPIPVVISNIKPLDLPDAPRAEQATLTTIHELALHAINLGAGAQMRVERNEVVVNDYAEAMKRGEIFPMPIVYAEVISDEGEPISEPILADGFHRIAAARRAGLITLAAPRSLYNTYINADRRMRHVQVRQDDWVFRRGDEISEQLGADRVDYIIPVGGESAAIKLCFGEFGEEHTEMFFNGDAGEPTRDHGRTYEQPLARLEALVKAMKGVK